MLNIYGIFDNKALSYTTTFTAINNAIARRGIIHSVKSGGSQWAEYPTEFSLMRFGTFDPVTGKFDLEDAPELLGTIAVIIGNGE